jgi:hypothetical protein
MVALSLKDRRMILCVVTENKSSEYMQIIYSVARKRATRWPREINVLLLV